MKKFFSHFSNQSSKAKPDSQATHSKTNEGPLEKELKAIIKKIEKTKIHLDVKSWYATSPILKR